MSLDSSSLDDVEKTIDSQVESWIEAVRDRSVQKYVKRNLFLLFAAICGHESGAWTEEASFHGSDNLGAAILSELSPNRKSLQSRVNEEAKQVAKVQRRLSEIPRQQRASVLKSSTTLQRVPETFESCESIKSAKRYLNALKTSHFKSSSSKKNQEPLEKRFSVERNIWKYWLVYDACLKRLHKQRTSVSAETVLGECVTALDSLKTWIAASDDEEDGLRQRKKPSTAKAAVREDGDEHADGNQNSGSVISSSSSQSEPESLDETSRAKTSVWNFFKLFIYWFFILEVGEQDTPPTIVVEFGPSSGPRRWNFFSLKNWFVMPQLDEQDSPHKDLEAKEIECKRLRSELAKANEENVRQIEKLRKENEDLEANETKCKRLERELTSARQENEKNTRQNENLTKRCNNFRELVRKYKEETAELKESVKSNARENHLVMISSETRDAFKGFKRKAAKATQASNERATTERGTQVVLAGDECVCVHCAKSMAREKALVQREKILLENKTISPTAISDITPSKPSSLPNGKPPSPGRTVIEVEEISDPRRPSEMARRYNDLFNHSYGLLELYDEVLGKSDEEGSRFIVDMLKAVHRASRLAINDTQNRLLKAIGLESSLDRPKAQKTAIDCTVSLCKIMPTPITAKSHEDVKKRFFENWREKRRDLKRLRVSVNEFLDKCIPVFWDVMLLKHSLFLITDHQVFNPSQHERFYGSEVCQRIDYFVWPCLVEEETSRVLSRGKVVTKTKPSRNSSSSKSAAPNPIKSD
ncbi:uncharacterized protein [Oscarella lobularis]|uniref:uncharacterized protein n=1 Tax=Oscarella lobularis TaxID=121494 RepID=UPI003313FF62